MPTDPPANPPPDPSASPPAPPAPAAPAGPTKDEVKDWVREALAEGFGGKPSEDPPDLSTDKKLEAFVEKLTREAMEKIKAEEIAKGTPPPDPGPDPKPAPETDPEPKRTWQEKVREALWGTA